jgi:hypothetical protein
MDYTAYKFNPENNEIINYFKINEHHNWIFPYMVYGDNYIWVIDFTGYPFVVFDSETGEVIKELNMSEQQIDIGGMAYNNDILYLVIYNYDTEKFYIYHLSSEDGAILNIVEIKDNLNVSMSGAVFYNNFIWVFLDTDPIRMVSINTDTGELIKSFSVDEKFTFIWDFAKDNNNGFWVKDGDNIEQLYNIASGELKWLSHSPDAGTLGKRNHEIVQFEFDSNKAYLGENIAKAVIKSDDPYNPVAEILIDFHVHD